MTVTKIARSVTPTHSNTTLRITHDSLKCQSVYSRGRRGSLSISLTESLSLAAVKEKHRKEKEKYEYEKQDSPLYQTFVTFSMHPYRMSDGRVYCWQHTRIPLPSPATDGFERGDRISVCFDLIPRGRSELALLVCSWASWLVLSSSAADGWRWSSSGFQWNQSIDQLASSSIRPGYRLEVHNTLKQYTTRVPCSNAAKTRNPLKFAGMPQTNEKISVASKPKFTIL